MQKKVIVAGKVQQASSRKFKIKKDKDSEVDVDVEIEEDGTFEAEKLSIDDLPTNMHDGTPIKWFNNFAVKKNGQYINERYKVKIVGISNIAPSRLIIFDGNGDPYYYTGAIVDDSFELTDGDPAIGKGP